MPSIRARIALLFLAVLMASCSTVDPKQNDALDEELTSYVGFLLKHPRVYDREKRSVTTDLHLQAYAAAEVSRFAHEIPGRVSRQRMIEAMATAARKHGLGPADAPFLDFAFGPEFWKEVKEKRQRERAAGIE